MPNDFVSIIKPNGAKSGEEQGEEATGGLLPVLPVRDTVLFPHAVLPLTVGRESSIQLIESLGEDRSIAVTAQKDARLDTPTPDDMHAVGTLATVPTIYTMYSQNGLVVNECA